MMHIHLSVMARLLGEGEMLEILGRFFTGTAVL
jgi:hypothetical protein